MENSREEIVNVYIDGFNFYHPIRDYHEYTGGKSCFKWLNYRSLVESILKPNQKIGKIYFFSAICSEFGEDFIKRHNL